MSVEMPANTSQTEADSLPDAAGVETDSLPERGRVRLLTLDHLDGRTLAAQRVRGVEAALVEDLGGDDAVSTAQRALVRRSAVLAAILEDREARWATGEALDLEPYLAGANALRRLLTTIGLERRAKSVTPTVSEWIEQQRQAQE